MRTNVPDARGGTSAVVRAAGKGDGTADDMVGDDRRSGRGGSIPQPTEPTGGGRGAAPPGSARVEVEMSVPDERSSVFPRTSGTGIEFLSADDAASSGRVPRTSDAGN